ncbi:MAG: hypothetical protein EBX52_08990, partial [Proteobacteria bacterium]|nr:hypothetical protein [Pseudomonadota bacterium]
MIDRIPSQSRSLERAVLGFGILFIAGPAVIFGLNIEITERFFGAKDVLSQSNIGEIIRPKNVVKKKGNEDSAYGSARQGDPIYVGDTVMTGKESFTRVTLSDGSVLDLGPETLVRIEPVRSFSLKGIKKKLKITVEAGAVKAKTKTNSAPIVIESSSGEILKEIIAPPVVMTTPTPAPPVAAVSGTPVALVTAPAAVAAEDEFFEAVVTAPTPAPADSAPSKKESVIAKIFSTKPESTPKPVAT